MWCGKENKGRPEECPSFSSAYATQVGSKRSGRLLLIWMLLLLMVTGIWLLGLLLLHQLKTLSDLRTSVQRLWSRQEEQVQKMGALEEHLADFEMIQIQLKEKFQGAEETQTSGHPEKLVKEYQAEIELQTELEKLTKRIHHLEKVSVSSLVQEEVSMQLEQSVASLAISLRVVTGMLQQLGKSLKEAKEVWERLEKRLGIATGCTFPPPQSGQISHVLPLDIEGHYQKLSELKSILEDLEDNGLNIGQESNI